MGVASRQCHVVIRRMYTFRGDVQPSDSGRARMLRVGVTMT